MIAAVADGLGSHPTSQIGAEIATRTVCAALRARDVAHLRSDARDDLAHAIDDTNAEMRRIRELGFADLVDRDLETTLAFVWVSRAEPRWVAAGRIGDCEVFVLRGDALEPIFERGEGALNRVQGVLPASEPSRSLEVCTVELGDATALVLGTDGLANDVAGSPTVARWLAERWARPCGVHRMIDTLRYRRQGSHDDRTVLAVWPVPADATP